MVLWLFFKEYLPLKKHQIITDKIIHLGFASKEHRRKKSRWMIEMKQDWPRVDNCQSWVMVPGVY